MTVSSTVASLSRAFNGTSTAFPLSGLQAITASDLVVTFVAADGTEAVKTLGDDYTVTGNLRTGAATLTISLPKQAGFVSVRVERRTAAIQDVHFTAGSAAPAASQERQLDRVAMVLQEHGAAFAAIRAAVAAATAAVATIGGLVNAAVAAAIATYHFVVASVAGQAVSTRGLLAGIVAPIAGQQAYLSEKGRAGWFVFDTSDLSAKVTLDTAQALYVAPAAAPNGASGAWVRQYDFEWSLAWFGAAPGQDIAPAARAALAMVGNQGAVARLPFALTPYLWNSPVDWNARLSLIGGEYANILGCNGVLRESQIDVPAGVTPIIPQRGTVGYAAGCAFKGLVFNALGRDTTTTTGTMAANSYSLTLAAAIFTNKQIIRYRGAGPQGYLQRNGLRGTTVSGSPVITLTGTAHAASVGMYLDVGGAFGPHASVVSFTDTTLTMSVNATATVSAPTKIMLYGDIVGYVRSGGGTTTVQLNSTPHRDCTNHIVQHYDSAIFGFDGFTPQGVVAKGFQGCAVGLAAGGRLINPAEGGATNANMYPFHFVQGYACRNAIFIDGTDANAGVNTQSYGILCDEACFVDQSLLGIHWNGLHCSGGRGVLHVYDTSPSSFVYAYHEGGTVGSFGALATGLGIQPADEDGGLRFIAADGALGAPVLSLYPSHSTDSGTVFLGTRRRDYDAAGLFYCDYSAVGGSGNYQLFDTWRSGLLGITDLAGNTTPIAITMGGHPLGVGHVLLQNGLYLGDGTKTAGNISTSNFIRMLSGTAAPTTGTWALGTIVKNKAPAVGQPKGWVCTVAGTPGTWVSEGNL